MRGSTVIVALATQVLAHEVVCLLAGRPEELLTRVIGRWRKRHIASRLLVDGFIYYLAGHLTEMWARDPLSLRLPS